MSVTNFFRDPEAFESLAEKIIPKLFEGKQAGDKVRVLVAGCGMPEDAYSVTILLSEYSPGIAGAPAIEVLALDIDRQSITEARDRLYRNAEVVNLSVERLRRFFTKEPGGYRLRRDFQERVFLADPHLLGGPPASPFDLVFCRNLPDRSDLAGRVATALHFSLRPGGYLFLTEPEPVDIVTGLFAEIDEDHRIYQRQEASLLHEASWREVVLPDLAYGFLLNRFGAADRERLDESRKGHGIQALGGVAIGQVEEELTLVKRQLRVALERHNSQQEELEILNGGLRVTNEELQIERAQVRSVNERLEAVNQALEVKVRELSRTNHDFRNLIASTQIGTIFIDRSLHIKFYTPEAGDIFNFIPSDVDRPLLDLTNQLRYQDLLSDIESVFSASLAVEREVQTRSEQWYLMRLLPYCMVDGRIDGVVITFLDISERKRAEEERERLLAREHAAREEAERANRLKDEFLTTFSHELRSPLNAILGWLRLLRSGGQDEQEIAHAYEVMERNIRLQSRLIEDLLDTARIGSGKLQLQVKPVGLAEVVERALDVVRPAAEAKAIELCYSLDGNAGIVFGDPDRLQQVIWNLLSNAVKFTPAGGRVTIESDRQESHLCIVVKDTGQGIEPEFLPYIFNRFSQGSASATQRHSGLGLGLALVRHLVELHGGTVRAESRGKGDGAAFTVKLPVWRADRQPTGLPQRSGVESPGTNAASSCPESLAGVRVLAVDDQADARELIEVALAGYGAEVITAASCAEMVEILSKLSRDQLPDIVICDIGMPSEDGYAAMSKLLAFEDGCRIPASDRIPAIAVSGYINDQARARALAAGFRRHLSKPVEPDELVMVIASLTGCPSRSVSGSKTT